MKTHKRLLLLFSVAAALTVSVSGQDKGMLPSQLLDKQDITLPQQITGDQYPLDAPVDPEWYIVGGGDRFSVQIETVPPLNMPLTVGADGYLLVPSVGRISVGGKTLAKAVEEVQTNARRIRREASVILIGARRVLVRTAGNALFPKMFEATASDRVSTVVANPLVVRSELPSLPKEAIRDPEPVTIARRSILLKRVNGTQQRVDLDMFYATGDSRWNPHISEGDEIVAQVLDENVPSIAIGGAVWLPGRFEYVTGDRVCDLVRFGRGVRSFARIDSVILARPGQQPQKIDLASADTMISLESGDRLWIPYERSLRQADMVAVSGEVHMPGTFPLVKGSTRLSDVLQMAGGTTEQAMLHGATLHRMRQSPSIYGEDLLLAQRGNKSVDDTSYVRQEGMLRLLGERVNVDFRRVLESPGTIDDPFLEAGDRIAVPRHTGTVYVFGQVAAPGHQTFIAGHSFGDYVGMAGGYTARARTGDAVVIKYASRQWLDPDDTVVEEGDAIWVPKEVEQTFAIEAMAYGQIASILSSIATLALVIIQLAK